MVIQRPAKDLSDSQLELIGGKRAAKVSAPVDKRYLYALPSLRRVLRYSMSLRDLEPKQVYEQLNKDAAAWSRIENGSISFPAEEIAKFQRITGNKAVMMWLAYQGGDELVPRRDALEIENEELRAQLAQAERDKTLMIDVFKQVRGS